MALDKKTSEEKTKRTFCETHGCKWITAGRKCQMLGTLSGGPESKHWLCLWHYDTQSYPEITQSFEEFTKWRDMDRKTYPKDCEYSGLYVNDNLVWACILGKKERREYVKAMIAIEKEIEMSSGRINKTKPDTVEVSVQKVANSFDEIPF